ncbi:unnamed protein product [Bursaphelenchus xylophilus]|uniref:(pine wood nematode) hypothetical protein n=1 Tax=Bursaphelenchus xylophilus TaxID=6326 RepID=A0A1I7SQN4_BURXY|nr:unnamed protein product [Bursaphelenchus xylophilus]CAG9110146.1 unnamed protein product [Bursaphelenchus xylophilus]
MPINRAHSHRRLLQHNTRLRRGAPATHPAIAAALKKKLFSSGLLFGTEYDSFKGRIVSGLWGKSNSPKLKTCCHHRACDRSPTVMMRFWANDRDGLMGKDSIM